MENELIGNLTEAIADVIDKYTVGHAIPYATVVGVLHMLAFDYIEMGREEAEEDENNNG